MLGHGFLSGGAFYPSLAHTAAHVDRYLAAAEEVFAELGEAIRQGDVAGRIGGPIRHSGFARLA
jgi:glutamate-1-semialdehyde 2,1-aminomutase